MDRVIFLARHNRASEGKDTHSVILIQNFCLHDGRYAYRRLHAVLMMRRHENKINAPHECSLHSCMQNILRAAFT